MVPDGLFLCVLLISVFRRLPTTRFVDVRGPGSFSVPRGSKYRFGRVQYSICKSSSPELVEEFAQIGRGLFEEIFDNISIASKAGKTMKLAIAARSRR